MVTLASEIPESLEVPASGDDETAELIKRNAAVADALDRLVSIMSDITPKSAHYAPEILSRAVAQHQRRLVSIERVRDEIDVIAKRLSG